MPGTAAARYYTNYEWRTHESAAGRLRRRSDVAQTARCRRKKRIVDRTADGTEITCGSCPGTPAGGDGPEPPCPAGSADIAEEALGAHVGVWVFARRSDLLWSRARITEHGCLSLQSGERSNAETGGCFGQGAD